MADIIVVLIVIVLLGFALRGAIRHFKGDRGIPIRLL